MAVRSEAMPGAPDQVAFLFGPVVLAGDLGAEPASGSVPYTSNQRANLNATPVDAPVLAGGPAPAESCVIRSVDRRLEFHFSGLSVPVNVVLRPFWEMPYNRYNVYWKMVAAIK